MVLLHLLPASQKVLGTLSGSHPLLPLSAHLLQAVFSRPVIALGSDWGGKELLSDSVSRTLSTAVASWCARRAQQVQLQLLQGYDSAARDCAPKAWCTPQSHSQAWLQWCFCHGSSISEWLVQVVVASPQWLIVGLHAYAGLRKHLCRMCACAVDCRCHSPCPAALLAACAG